MSEENPFEGLPDPPEGFEYREVGVEEANEIIHWAVDAGAVVFLAEAVLSDSKDLSKEDLENLKDSMVILVNNMPQTLGETAMVVAEAAMARVMENVAAEELFKMQLENIEGPEDIPE